MKLVYLVLREIGAADGTNKLIVPIGACDSEVKAEALAKAETTKTGLREATRLLGVRIQHSIHEMEVL